MASNQSIPAGANSTTDAVAAGASITVPGNQTVNITIFDGSGQPANATSNAYLQYLPGLTSLPCNTTTGGYCQVTYNPTCNSTAGVQKWYGETDDVCYETEYTTTDEDLVVYGQLYVSLQQPSSGTVINRNTAVNLSAFVRDDCSSYVNDTSVAWYNETWSQVASGYDTTWQVPYNYPLGPEILRVNTSRQYFDGNTNTTNVLVYGWAAVDYISPVNNTEASAGDEVTVTCHVKDANTGQNLTGYEVSFLKDGIQQLSNHTDSAGIATWLWDTQTDTAGGHNISCNITDNTTLYYNVSFGLNQTTVIIHRPLKIAEIWQNYTWIYRNDSFSPNATHIRPRVKDANLPPPNDYAENAVVHFYNSTSYLGNCTTDSNGYCYFLFNPGDSIYPQDYVIYMNATKPSTNEPSETNTTTVEVKGMLYMNITEPANGSLISKTLAWFLGNVSIWDENGNSSLSPLVTWYDNSGSPLTIVGGAGTQEQYIDPDPMTTGTQNITSTATKTHYDSVSKNVTITVSGAASVYWGSPPHLSTQPYPVPFNITCYVEDDDGGIPVENYPVEIWYKYEGQSLYTYNGTEYTNSTGYVSRLWVPESKTDINFKCNITDNQTLLYNASTTDADALIYIQDTEPPQIYNVSVIPNYSIEANLNYTNITATVTDNYMVYEVKANITYPNGTSFFLDMTNTSQDIFRAQYYPPVGGLYLVEIHAWDPYDEHNLNISELYNFTVWGKITPDLNASPDTEIADGITQTQDHVFNMSVNFTNQGPPNAYNVFVDIYESTDQVTFRNATTGAPLTNYTCGQMAANESCYFEVEAVVKAKTPPGLLQIHVNASWSNPDQTQNFTEDIVNVIVSSNPLIDILEDYLHKDVQHGENTRVGNLTVASTGNTPITDVNVFDIGGNLHTDCPECTLGINPDYQGYVQEGNNFTVTLDVEVPKGQPPGDYWTKIRANASNAAFDEALLNITVLTNRSWTAVPGSLGTIFTPLDTNGTLGVINYTNTGNVQLTLTFYRSGAAQQYIQLNNTLLGIYPVDVGRQVSGQMFIGYDIPANAPTGLIDGYVVITSWDTDTGTPGTPSSKNINFTLNITNPAPYINDLRADPDHFEILFENTTVSATITDNTQVVYAWVNVTQPDGNVTTSPMSNNGSYYWFNYSTNTTGLYTFKVCANDTEGVMGCEEVNATAVANTTVLAIPNATAYYAENVSIHNSTMLAIDFSTTTGYARAYNVTVNVTAPAGWNLSGDSFNYSVIYRNTSVPTPLNLTVPNGTLAGNYTLNFTSYWTNIDNSTSNSTEQAVVVVVPNPLIEIIEDNVTVQMGIVNITYGNATMTILSAGNTNITNITSSCVSGEACVNFTSIFGPQKISAIEPGQTADVTVEIYTPVDYPAGTYSGLLEAAADGGLYDTTDLFVRIPTNLSWTQTPNLLQLDVIQGTAGELGTVTLSNSGNVNPTVVDTWISPVPGDGDYFSAVPNGTLPIYLGIPVNVNISYTAPVVYSETNVTAYYRSYNNTAGTEITRSTELILTVHPYFINILSPTEAQPVINITSNKTVQVDVNLTYGTTAILPNESVAWNATLSDGTTDTPLNITTWFVNGSVNESKMLETAVANDTGFETNESIVEKGYLEYFNLTIENLNGIEIYFNLTVNGIQLEDTRTLANGSNYTVDAVAAGVNFTVPGNQTINLTLMNSTGDVVPAYYNAYLDYMLNSQQLGHWAFNFTAPNLPLSTAYDLNVSANYTMNGTNISLFYWDTEYKSVVYQDPTPPQISIGVTPKVSANTTTDIYVYVTDSGGVKNASATVTHAGFTEDLPLTFISRTGDTYTYLGQFSNTSQTGDYVINATAYDVSGNMNKTSRGFIVSVLILFHGFNYDEEEADPKPPLDVDYSLHYTDAGWYFNFTTNNGYYNQTIDAGTYDLNVKFWNETLDIYGSDILYDTLNALTFGKIKVLGLVGYNTRGLFEAITAEANQNMTSGNNTFAFTFDNATLSFNYSSYEGDMVSPDILGIYHCSNWVTGSGCADSWTRLSGTNYSLSQKTITAPLSELTGAYSVAEYICGNGECENDYGESSGNCPQDCEVTQPPQPPGGGRGAGGGGGGAISPPAPRLPIKIDSQLIFVTLRPGEHEIHSIDIDNNLAGTITADVEVRGNVWELVMIEKPTIDIRGSSTGTIKIKVFTLPSTMEGIYTGDIVTRIRGMNITHVTPITVKVQKPKEPLLDVKVKALTKTVEPNSNLSLELTLLNMGETAKIDDIVVTYEMRHLDTERIVLREQETLGMENVRTFKKTIFVPDDTPIGRYSLEVNVTYWNGTKQAYAIDSFDVLYIAPPLKIIRGIFSSWITYALLFAIIPGYYFGSSFYYKYRKKKKAKTRYIFPMDVNKLPKAGDRSMLVGKVAETDIKAYMTLDDLTTHSIAAGSTGAGKSVSAQVCSEELLKRGVPVVVVDPTAQWTGFMRACKDPAMLDLYPKFGMKPEDAMGFKVNIIGIESPEQVIPWKDIMSKKGEMTVLVTEKLPPSGMDKFVRNTVESLFAMRLPESREMKMLMIYDEVHRLLPKYGGKGGYIVLERAAREFRKWGIGIFLISQVLMDFKGAIRANISTEIQLRTKYEGDINRVKTKYGPDYASKITKLVTGTGLVQNAAYNDGKPWFVSFRPLLHDTKRLTSEELDKYIKISREADAIKKQLESMKQKGVQTGDVEVELNLALDKLKQGLFTMAESYMESVRTRMKNM